MKNPLEEKDNTGILVPILIGAAAAAVIAYLFVSENGAEVRGKISENLNKGWDTLKEKIPVNEEDIANLKDKVVDTVTSGFKSGSKDVREQI